MRKVHADDVETGIAESVDGLDGVGLGTNGADDGGTAEVVLRSVGSVEASEPSKLTTADVEVILSGRGNNAHGARTLDSVGNTLRHDGG